MVIVKRANEDMNFIDQNKPHIVSNFEQGIKAAFHNLFIVDIYFSLNFKK